jgi:hypothetical protein
MINHQNTYIVIFNGKIFKDNTYMIVILHEWFAN